jgi:hypothetical protein
MLVLRLGVRSVFVDEDTCHETAPELYQASAVFVSLSIAAWSTIVLGYLVPFCFVAILLTWNGYTPAADTTASPEETAGTGFGVFPAAFSREGAPPGCIDQLRTITLENFPESYPKECCICMSDFVHGEIIVVTECEHVFHRRCCQEWLRQARTCPVCRTDIPSALAEDQEAAPDTAVSPPSPHHRAPPSGDVAGVARTFPRREEFRQEVVNIARLIQEARSLQEARLRERSGSADRQQQGVRVGGSDTASMVEEGRSSSSASIQSGTRY